VQETWQYFVDLECSGVNGHNNVEDNALIVDVIRIIACNKLSRIWALTTKFNKFAHHQIMFSL